MKLIHITEAADRLGVSRQTMTNWCKSGVFKLHKMGTTGNSYWVDAAAIDAVADTAADIVHTKQLLVQEQEDTRRLYKEEHEMLADLRREVFMVKKFGEGVTVREFYLSIPVMLQELDLLTHRESTIMQRMIGGDEVSWIAEDFGLTRTRIMQIFFKCCNKAKKLQDLKKKFDEAEELQKELEYLRKQYKDAADYIRELEEKLEIKNKPQEETDRELMMKLLRDCDLTARTHNCLKAADIKTVGDLLKLNRDALLQFRNFGKKSLAELDRFLESIGKEWGTKYLVRNYETLPDGRNFWRGYKLSDTPERD